MIRTKVNMLLVLLASFLSLQTVHAQLTIDANLTPEEIAQNLVGTGIQISNVSVNAADSAYSYYYSTGTEIGTSQGLLLSTGNVINALGPNNTSGLPIIVGGNCLNCDLYDNDWPGSELLDNAQDRTTYDASLFEFDVIPQGDSLKFDFTFASEEYLEWVGSPFNDVFGFYITGPNIGVDVNIALIPGTNTAVAINSINPGSFPEYYFNNQNPPGQFVQYDGFTVGLKAVVGDLIPCQTYHLKLIIADGTDRLYDSAVFVERIESNPVTVLTATAGGIESMIEGCNDGTISFVRPEATSEAQVVTFWIGGTATDGVDYTPAIGTGTPGDPLTIVIPANETTATIDLEAIADGLDEGEEYITIYLANPLCNNGIQDSVNFYIADFLEVNLNPIDPTICLGECIELESDAITEGLAVFSWDPLEGLTTPNSTSTEACPETTTTYTITSQVSECIATASTTVTVTNIILELTSDPVNCADVNFGEIDLTVNDGTGPLSYEWTGPDGFTADTEDLSGLASGTYCVVVTDSNGCIGEACIDVVESDVLEVETVTLSDYICFPISCFGACDGSITLNITGGVGAYTVTWDDPAAQSGLTASDLCAGTYTATITDEAGCEITETITLDQPDEVEIEVVGQVDVLCNGEETGLATVTATGGCTPYFYSWSHDPELTAPVATNLPSGTFTATVNDVNGCSSTNSVTITIGEPGEPISATHLLSTYPGGFNVSCPDATDGSIDLTVSGGTPEYSYQWFQGELFLGATQDISGLACGTYTVIITDSNDCQYIENITLSCPPEIEVSFVSTPNPCLDPNAGLGAIDITVSGGFGGFGFEWSGPGGFSANTEDISGLNSGTYTVIITDAQGCTRVQNIVVATSDGISLTASLLNASCFGACDGAITLFISGGTAPFDIEWTFGGEIIGTTEEITEACAGLYEVVVTDAAGCIETAQFELISSPEIVIDVIEAINPSCFGQNNGSIDIEISGGTGALDIEWLPNPNILIPFPGSTDEDLNNLFDGVYTVVVTDAVGCSTSLDISLEGPQVMDIFVEVTNFNGGFNVSCAGAGDGQISVSVSGGSPDCVLFPNCYEFDWGTSPIGSNDPASPTLLDLGGGTFLVVVTDANGCIATTEINLTEPEEIDAAAVLSDYNGFNVSCPGASDGSITPNVIGGNGDFVFDWSSGDDIGANDPYATTLTNLPAGTYVLEITDTNDCTSTETFILTEPDPMDVVIDAIVPVSCFEYSDGAISISVNGGAGPYTYEWTGPSCPCTGNVISGLSAGTYTVTVTDANNCTYTEDVVLDEPPFFDISLVVNQIACNGEATGSITTLIEGGVGPFTTTWTLDGGFFSNSTNISDLGPGEYCVTVEDAGGCEQTECVIIEEPAEALVVTATPFVYGNGFNISCFGACDGSIDLEVSGGVPPYTFVWRDEFDNEISFDEDLIDVCAGEYEVLIEDAAGCTETLLFDLTEPEELLLDSSLSDYNGFGVSCFGSTDGSISVTASGGGGEPYSYDWTGDFIGSGSELTGLGAGSYVLTVTDGSDCQLITTFTLTEPQEIGFAPEITEPACFGEETGSIDANITGGVAPYTISWDELPDDTEIITGLSSGTYTITVTDANGCETTESFELNEPVLLQAEFEVTAASCGEANGAVTLDVSGGIAPYEFSWNGPSQIPAGTEDPQDILAGTYTLTITDANDCELLLDIEVPGPDAIVLDAVVVDLLCAGDANGNIVLSVSNAVEPFAAEWTFGGEPFDIGTELSDLEGGVYEVVVTDDEGCSASASFVVNEPTPILINGESPLYPNDYNISSFEGSDGTITTDVQGGTPGYDYQWSGPSSIEDGTENPNGLTGGAYTLTITDSNGCVRDTVIVLTMPFDLALPTGLSPNGDNLNDTYVILGLDQHPENTFKVFNRWGNLVYEKNNYDNEWAGTNNDGENLPDGTYYVVFESNQGRALNTYVDLRR